MLHWGRRSAIRSLLALAALVGAVALAACQDAVPGPGSVAEPDWTGVAGTLERHCSGCHAPERIASGWSMHTHDEVVALRHPMEAALTTGAMPPWPAAPVDVAYADSRALPEADRAYLLDWLEAGAPPWGDPPRELSAPAPAALPRVDETLTPEEPYTPRQSPDDRRCFRLPLPETGRWVVGARIVPSNPDAAHHARLMQVPEGFDVTPFEAEDEDPGWDCTEGLRVGGDAVRLANWIPGYTPPVLPEGTGFWLAESPLVLVVHYWTPSFEGDATDWPRVELMVEGGPQDARLPLEYLLLRDESWRPGRGIAIPEGQTEASHSQGFVVADLAKDLHGVDISGGLQAYTAVPHMHEHGARTRLVLEPADGSEPTELVRIPRWDVDWQLEYAFAEPVEVGPDDVLRVGCSYQGDGSEVVFGRSVEDEMCSMRMLVSAVR